MGDSPCGEEAIALAPIWYRVLCRRLAHGTAIWVLMQALWPAGRLRAQPCLGGWEAEKNDGK